MPFECAKMQAKVEWKKLVQRAKRYVFARQIHIAPKSFSMGHKLLLEAICFRIEIQYSSENFCCVIFVGGSNKTPNHVEYCITLFLGAFPYRISYTLNNSFSLSPTPRKYVYSICSYSSSPIIPFLSLFSFLLFSYQ